MELFHAAATQVRVPFRGDLGDGGRGDGDRLLSAVGQLDQPGAAVSGIGDAFDPARSFELVDEVARGLFGHWARRQPGP